ncbi:MAG: glycoside hydrolase family 11 protein, partial [Fibrobacter sp.]|nr:glycoside hydrolase family 11 protein [Fibrobacter sp.]
CLVETRAENNDKITFPYVINNVNEIGPMPNGYDYEMWKHPAGEVKMTVYNDEAKFDAEWNNVINFLARVGLKYDETRTHDQIGTITADFEFKETKTPEKAMVYYGIYGWTVDPLVEFYIMENWTNWRPREGDGKHFLKDVITVDGSEYDVITRDQKNCPSIKGDGANFLQILNIRKDKRSSGNISISEHFKHWERLGLEFGNLYEVKLKVETYKSDSTSCGACKLTKGEILVNGKIPASTMPMRDMLMRGCKPMANGKSGAFTIFSLNGQRVKSVPFDLSGNKIVTISNIAPGLYIQTKGNSSTLSTRPMLVK